MVHFSYNFCSSFIFVHLSSSTQPESVGSNPALNHKFFNEFFGIVRPKKYFFSKKNQNFFLKKKIFFPNFSNSCSLNIFEPKIWRRLGTFPSCFSSDYNPHTDRSTFLTILTILKSYNSYLANSKYWLKNLRSSIFTSSKKLKGTKGYSLRVFSAL